MTHGIHSRLVLAYSHGMTFDNKPMDCRFEYEPGHITRGLTPDVYTQIKKCGALPDNTYFDSLFFLLIILISTEFCPQHQHLRNKYIPSCKPAIIY